jgi:hypothetical protein
MRRRYAIRRIPGIGAMNLPGFFDKSPVPSVQEDLSVIAVQAQHFVHGSSPIVCDSHICALFHAASIGFAIEEGVKRI